MSALSEQQFKQQRIPGLSDVPLKQPHQMKPLEFAAHPDTMWHGSDSSDFEHLRGYDVESRGFHVGTLTAAADRVRDRRHSREEGYVHPVRVEDMRNTPKEAIPDQGENWTRRHHRKFYVNDFEDKGSASAIMPSADHVRHYADYVHEALARGGIPSGEARHFVTQTGEEHSPGFSLRQWKVGSAEDPRALTRRPPYRNPFDPSSGPEQHQMIVQASGFTPEGEHSGKVETLNLSAVPAEHQKAVHELDMQRKQPWLDRMERADKQWIHKP